MKTQRGEEIGKIVDDVLSDLLYESRDSLIPQLQKRLNNLTFETEITNVKFGDKEINGQILFTSEKGKDSAVDFAIIN